MFAQQLKSSQVGYAAGDGEAQGLNIPACSSTEDSIIDSSNQETRANTGLWQA